MTNIQRFDLLLKELQNAGVAKIRIEALDAELRPKYQILDQRAQETEQALTSSLKALAGWLNMHDISVREKFLSGLKTSHKLGWTKRIIGYMKEEGE